MKIQIKSDTHNEYSHNTTKSLVPDENDVRYVNPEADVVILAGDISESEIAETIVDQYANCGKPVLYVAGNHDYWYADIEEAKAKRKKLFEGTNITELDRDFKIIDNVVFAGATLWSNLAKPVHANLAERTADFKRIKGMTPERWHNLHLSHLDYFESICMYPDFTKMKKVLISHYLPSKKSTPDRFKGEMINCIFSSNCEHVMHLDEENAPVVWFHGHTHDSFDYVEGKTRVICNPYGYHGYETNPNYKPNLLIEI